MSGAAAVRRAWTLPTAVMAASTLTLALMGAGSNTVPRAPLETVDTGTLPAVTRRVPVADGAGLQQALDAARPGDWIELQSGATYTGPFRLRRFAGDGWVVVTSSAPGLPAPGTRVGPMHAGLMPKLRAASQAVIIAEPGAHHYRFIGLDIAPQPGTWLVGLLQLGDDERSLDLVPHDIVVDRCYLHGDPRKGTRRGVALNARRAAVIDSHLADFKEAGADSQAIAGWNGPGPFAITNNYLEGAGENVMFGGADPSIDGLVPSDIVIRHNHLAKPLQWRTGTPGADATAWTVKNLFELKNARRVLVEGNLLEYNWPAAQNGFAVLFTVRNQSGKAPWSVVEDVTFANNIVRHVGAGINILGTDDIHPSRQTRRIAITGNLFADVGGSWGSGRLYQVLDGTGDVSIRHNTAFNSGFVLFGGDHGPHVGFVFEDNVALHNETGIAGSGTGSGRESLDRYFPAASVKGNVLIGGDPSRYPSDNFFPVSLDAAGFVSGADGT
jgi:hypothetical protein